MSAMSTSRYDRQLVRGTLVNVAGTIARLTQPVFLIVVTWLYGPEVMGVFLLALAFYDVLSGVVHAGFLNAVTVLASHHVEGAAEDAREAARLYRVLGNGFAWSAGASVVVALVSHAVGPALAARFLPEQRDLFPALHLMLWSLVPAAVAQLALAATKARMRMEYDAAVNGLARPLLALACAAVAWALHGGLVALMWANLAGWCLVAGVALWAYGRCFDGARTVAAVLRPGRYEGMLRYALPQAVDATLMRYVMRVDMMMLAAFGAAPGLIAAYGTASLLTSNLRQIRLVFSTAFAPVAARYHSAGDHESLQRSLAMLSRWTTTLVAPVVLVAAVLRDDLLGLFDRSYAGDTLYVVVLLVAPLVNCALGLAWNVILYVQRAGLSLVNTVLMAALNTALNVVLIPRHGLIGAAVAGAVATVFVSLLQIAELRVLERIRLGPRELWQPLAGLVAGALPIALWWDPAQLPPAGRAALAAASFLLFVTVSLATGHPELRALLRRKR
jgi:O-antigen/teichoic acid export membrane protein